MAADLHREWLSAKEIAALALPGVPGSQRGVWNLAQREGWDRTDKARRRAGRGGGTEYHISLLPETAQAALLAMRQAQAPGDAAAPAATDPRPKARRIDNDGRAALWAWFERQTDKNKDEGRRRLAALQRIDALEREMTTTDAVRAVATEFDVGVSTIYGWIERTRGVRRDDWLAALTPAKRGGARQKIEIDEDVWGVFYADYMRLSEPSFESCYRRTEAIAREQGWTMPTARTLRRRVDELPRPTVILARKGEDALKRLFPAQRRDRSHFHALQAVNTDGHKWDVFVRFEDGTIGRPLTIAFQDLYSGKFLAWRTGKSENKDAVRLAFGDMITAFGIPDHLYLDNGRAFASKWLTGGTPNRYRFKVKDEDPAGIITQLGVEIHWTTPYAGQSKPIERGFRDFATDIAKHPAFEGAYTGNTPLAKPENYGSRAIPFDEFRRIIDREIRAHNARPGRRSDVCGGRLSFDEAFDASFAQSLIRRATEAQRRLCLMAAESVRVRPDGTIHLFGNRYFNEALLDWCGKHVVARFDPDNLHAPVLVGALDGSPIAEAAVLEAAGFDDTEKARQHAQARRQFRRGVKEQLSAEQRLSLADLAKLQPKEEAPEAVPAPAATRPFHPSRKSALALDMSLEDDAQAAREAEDLRFETDFRKGLRLIRGALTDE
jgi:transposase InsO family protein